ncbi:MAG: N-6 DNA methylase, partial [Campylobacter sp.]|nr:N-6 DNA methylase [Campylobacter sp.]
RERESNESEIWEKEFTNHSCKIEVDFKKEKIIYPFSNNQIGRNTTTNFKDNENFVVLECVCRLLEKGYNPKDIYLEKPYQSGHDSKPLSFKDIQVNKGENAYLIIECKTAGGEFDKEWKNMQNYGGQLFSYFVHDRKTEFIALYTSDFVNNEIIPTYKIISLKDNDEYLKINKFKKSYKESGDQNDIFKVWKEVYGGEYQESGIFEPEIATYNIGYLKPTLNSLQTINSKIIQAKRYDWATILRANSVGDRGQALNKLMNLFLCKITDELENPTDLQFNWQGKMIDTSFALVDRLQKLYKIGMQNYLNKEITYYSKDDIKHAFTSDFNGVIIQEKVENIFNELKYFQNGDFNFIEVYNKELFDENFKILLEIVKSLENMKFTHNEDANILGDYFETYIKDLPQQEGQYFTPVPIVNFIVYSIPVFKFNKVLDYACGAGHFLTQFFNKNKNAKSEFLGVEKDTRLSKISTIASFMNHAHSQMKIKSANSLSKGELQDSYFNVLISNPPYSVKGFLEVLSPKDREEFSLLSSSTIDKTDDIECYFIEKASQVLQTNGILALVLPNSLLNNSGIFEKTREILIRDFNIISICELGGGTFYKTTTSTMIIFAVRKEVCKDTITSQNDIYLDIYNLILNNKFDKALKTYKNLDEMLSKYCDFRSYNKDEFIKLLNLDIDENSILFENENFKEYLNAYNNDILEKEYKAYEAKSDKHKRVNPFNPSISENEFIRKIECEKILYFCYCYDSNPIIIKSPKGAELKKFLGYEWSSSKGSEGIQILGDKLNTTLFNDDNRFDTNKLNFYILQEFLNKLDKDLLDEKFMSEYMEFKDIPSELEKYAFRANLCDLMDFSKPKFDKAISLEKREMAQMEIVNKYPLVKFENITTSVGKGKRPASFENADGEIIFYKSSQEIYKCDTADFDFEALIIGDGGSANVHYHNGKFSSSDHTYIFTPKDNAVIKFVYYVLNSNLQILESKFSGISIKNISKTSINNLKIPLPPIDIQKQIVDECQSVDNEISTLNSEISKFQQKLQ